MKKTLVFLTIIISLLTVTSAWADMVIPNTFSPGTPAVAASVNENFQAIENATPGVTFPSSTSTGISVSTTNAFATTLTLTAPTDGYAIVNASGAGNCFTAWTSLEISIKDFTNNVPTIIYNHKPPDYRRFHLSDVFQVSAGVTEFQLIFRCAAGNGAAAWNAFYAIFVPNVY